MLPPALGPRKSFVPGRGGIMPGEQPAALRILEKSISPFRYPSAAT